MLNKEEYLRKLKELAEKPGNIEGIYNYCDRWCERCSFTSKCLNYAMQDAAGFDKDIDNANFWENLHIIFEATQMMLEEDMKRFGIIQEDISTEIENKRKVSDDERSEKHPLTKQAMDMGISVMKWLEEFHKRNDKLEEIGIKPGEQEPNLKNAIEVLSWYALFISAKINRAVSYFYDDFEDESLKFDSDGSAKIALVAIDRSIEAWTFLYTKLSADEEIILKYLLELSSIQKQMEALFPDARKFIRPGFDEILNAD
jgi:hypothetical protein